MHSWAKKPKKALVPDTAVGDKAKADGDAVLMDGGGVAANAVNEVRKSRRHAVSVALQCIT